MNQAQVFVHFISDRNGAVDIGFVIAYERGSLNRQQTKQQFVANKKNILSA